MCVCVRARLAAAAATTTTVYATIGRTQCAHKLAFINNPAERLVPENDRREKNEEKINVSTHAIDRFCVRRRWFVSYNMYINKYKYVYIKHRWITHMRICNTRFVTCDFFFRSHEKLSCCEDLRTTGHHGVHLCRGSRRFQHMHSRFCSRTDHITYNNNTQYK